MDPHHSAPRPLAPLHAVALDLAPSRPSDPATAALGTLLSSGSSHVQGPPQKQKRIACRECRQAKVRCDGLNRYSTSPCVRCRRFTLDCHIDLNYKRVNKRIKIDELVQQVEQLRSAVAGQGTPNDFTSNDADNGSLRNPSQSPRHPPGIQDSLSQCTPQPMMCESRRPPSNLREDETFVSQPQRDVQEGNSPPEVCSPSQNGTLPRPSQSLQPASFPSTIVRSLEDLELTSQQISYLFHTFFENYHHFLEILDISLSPDQYYDQSPLLFWCIISVAARRYEDDAALLATLSPRVIKLMWSTISVLPHSRFTIQAMLLISTWSFPTSSMSTDLSFMLVSIAKSASMQLGLHRPETVQDFLRVKTQFDIQEFQDVVKTWAGCFIAAQSVTTSIGQPSCFPCDWAINRACEFGNKYTLPDNLRHYLLIYKYIARVNLVMADNDGSPTGYPDENESCVLMAMLERDLVDLERQVNYKLTASHQILLSVACLQLRVYYFFITSNAEVRRRGLLKAYATSLTLISKATDADAGWNFILYAPNIYSQMLIMAAMMLMKIINSSYSTYVDIDGGKRAFNTVLAMLRKASVENNDLRGRASTILAQLWGVHHSLTLRREQEPNINIKTRLGASLLHDLLWMWREEFGGQRVATLKVATMIPPQMGQSSTATELTPDLTPDNFNREDGWSTETTGSQNHDMAQQRATDMANDNFGSLGNLAGPFPDADWIWDIGFPSLLPIDIDFYPITLPRV